jgi:4-amino-4-deoxy-L-arabinose transferase-like glycosyltransferase
MEQNASLFLQLHRTKLALVILLFALGAFLRIYPSSSFHHKGFDEYLYEQNVIRLKQVGLFYYPEIVQAHIEEQTRSGQAKLPPTRFLYIFCGYLWSSLFQMAPLAALKAVSCAYTILLLALSSLFAWRLGGWKHGLAVLALMAVAPLQIHMAQHAFIDGVFAFWALLAVWLLWENLQRPDKVGLLFAYGSAIAAMVLTKENSFFIFTAIFGLILSTRWFSYGLVTRSLLFATLAGALVGVGILVTLAGGVKPFIDTYRLLVLNAQHLPYAIQTGDGPWYRYLVDLLLVSPVVLLLAVATLFQTRRNDHGAVFLVLFLIFSYVIMANVKNGMNLRYTVAWDMPLRFLAATQLFRLSGLGWRWSYTLPLFALGGLCLLELRQYFIFFVQHDLYELVTAELMYAVNILKVRLFH